MNKYDVVIIGAGLNSLATAAELKRAGKRVLVLEKRATTGGAATTEELIPGFRFNTCSDSAGWFGNERIPVELRQENAASVLNHKGAAFTRWRDMRELQALPQPQVQQFVKLTQLLFESANFLATLYTQAAPRPIDGGLGDLLALGMLGKRARKLGRAHMIELLRIMPMSVAELVGDYLEHDNLKALIAGQGILGVHQGPMSAGTVFTLLHHHIGKNAFDFRMVDRVRGGSVALANTLARGIEVRTNAPVDEIIVDKGRALGVRVGNDIISADSVASGLDVKTTLIDLLDVSYLDPEFLRTVRNVRSRGVVARVHLALSGLPKFEGLDEEALRGVISVGPDLEYLERAYDDIKYDRMSQAPVIEARIPSLDDASLAPVGRHTMSLSVQYVPYHADPAAVTELAIRTLSQYAPDLASHVIDSRTLTPRDLEREYGFPQGNIEHAELALDQILFMRPVPECARHATPIENLFLCGAGTHPGRVMPTVTGRHAANAILRRRPNVRLSSDYNNVSSGFFHLTS